MITSDWHTKGFSLSHHRDIADLLVLAMQNATWRPYRDIELLVESDMARPILDAVALEITERFGHNAKVTRREIWRGSIGGAHEYHSDMEDETNDCVAVICLTNAPQFPIDFKDSVTGEVTTYLPTYGGVLLINHWHPTALHRGPVTNGPNDEFIIGQVVMTCDRF